MESIDELELRSILKRRPATPDLIRRVLRRLMNPSMSWEEKRPFWYFLYTINCKETLVSALIEALDSKDKIPFDLVMLLCQDAGIEPKRPTVEAVFKGAKKQKLLDQFLTAKHWDHLDSRFAEARSTLLEEKLDNHRQERRNMLDKFEFLRSQRMMEQAGRELKRMVALYPNDPEFARLKKEFDEDWAREVLASRQSDLEYEKLEEAGVAISDQDREMLECFVQEGTHLASQNPQIANDLALAFLFLDQPEYGLTILSYSQPTIETDWLAAELMMRARRYIEVLEHLNQLEIKYISDPETTFAVSYMRAMALNALGQRAQAIEILQSITRVRANYRSAHALILHWTEGVG